MKRTERQQLKEDELATGLTRFLKWAKTRKKEFIALALGLTAVLIVLIAIKLVINYQKGQEASNLSEVLNLRADLEQKPENLAKLEMMAEKGSSKRVASLALASYYLEKNDLDKAEKMLTGVKDQGKDLLHYQILDLYGQILIKKNQFDEAIKIYKQMEKEDPKAYPLDVVLFHLAEAYEKKGESGQALSIYRDLQTRFQNSYYGYQASLKALKLEGAR